MNNIQIHQLLALTQGSSKQTTRNLKFKHKWEVTHT